MVGDHVARETALPAEAMEVKALRANEEYVTLGLRHALAGQKEQLNRLMGRDIGVPFDVSELSEPSPLETDLEVARARALERRPEIREAGLSVEQADLDRRMKKAEFIPDLGVGYSYLTPYNIDLLPRNLSSLRVSLSWEPFDWGRRKRELASKARAVEQARNTLEDARATVGMEVGTHFRRLEEGRVLVEASRLAQEAAREKSRVAMDRYRQQSALLKDVLQAQSDLAEANHRRQQAMLAYWTARADFEKAIGEE